MTDLSDRMKAYEACCDFELMKRVPIIIRVDIRSFHRLCRKLTKPYDPLFLEAMVETMYYMASEISGCVFAYHHNDEITFIVRNDQTLESEPWYNNKIQKIVSHSASIATEAFKEEVLKVKDKLPLTGKVIFNSTVFTVPSLHEAMNLLVLRQRDGLRKAITSASQALLIDRFGKKRAAIMLEKQNSKNKLKLMKEDCQIDFEQEYPSSFRLGVACYKTPILIPVKEGRETILKNKWSVNWELEDFLSSKEMILNILTNGQDIYRQDNIAI